MFPKVPQSSLGILKVPQLPSPLGDTPPLKKPIIPRNQIFCNGVDEKIEGIQPETSGVSASDWMTWFDFRT